MHSGCILSMLPGVYRLQATWLFFAIHSSPPSRFQIYSQILQSIILYGAESQGFSPPRVMKINRFFQVKSIIFTECFNLLKLHAAISAFSTYRLTFHPPIQFPSEYQTPAFNTSVISFAVRNPSNIPLWDLYVQLFWILPRHLSSVVAPLVPIGQNLVLQKPDWKCFNMPQHVSTPKFFSLPWPTFSPSFFLCLFYCWSPTAFGPACYNGIIPQISPNCFLLGQEEDFWKLATPKRHNQHAGCFLCCRSESN